VISTQKVRAGASKCAVHFLRRSRPLLNKLATLGPVILLSVASAQALAADWGSGSETTSLFRAMQSTTTCVLVGTIGEHAEQDARQPAFRRVLINDPKLVHCPSGLPQRWFLATSSFSPAMKGLLIGSPSPSGAYYSQVVFLVPAQLESILGQIRDNKIEQLLASTAFEGRTSGLTMLADLHPNICENLLDAYVHNTGTVSPSELLAFAEAAKTCPTELSIQRLRIELEQTELTDVAVVLFDAVAAVRPLGWAEVKNLLNSPNGSVRTVGFRAIPTFSESRTDGSWVERVGMETERNVRESALGALRRSGRRSDLVSLVIARPDDTLALVELVRDDASSVDEVATVDSRIRSSLNSTDRAVRTAAWETARVLLKNGHRPGLDSFVTTHVEAEPGLLYLQVLAATYSSNSNRGAFLRSVATNSNSENYAAALRASFEISQDCGQEATMTLQEVRLSASTQPAVSNFIGRLEEHIAANGGRPCP
jgi:hypothetical protein